MPSTGVTVLAAAVAGGLILVALFPLNADLAAGRAQQDADRAGASARWDQAVEANPTQITYRLGAGFAAEARGAESDDRSARSGFLTTALDRYQQARRMAPASLLATLGLARTETLMGQGVDAQHFEAADGWWRRAVRDDPEDWEVYNGYGLMLNSWANARSGDPSLRRRAADQLEKALQIKPDYQPAQVNLAKIRAALASG